MMVDQSPSVPHWLVVYNF